MSTSTKIMIPWWVPGDEISMFIQFCVGGEKFITKHPGGSSGEPWESVRGECKFVISKDRDGEITEFPGMSRMVFKTKYDDVRSCFIFTQHTEQGGIGTLVSTKSTPLWVAIAKKMVTTYGGKAFYDEKDEPNLIVKKGLITKSDFISSGKGFLKRQKFLIDLPPLSGSELREGNLHAAYTWSPDDDEAQTFDRMYAEWETEVLNKSSLTVSEKTNKKRI